MNFKIPCEIFLRLANVPRYFRTNVSETEKADLSCVRIEAKGGMLYAIASNRKIAAVYNLGETQSPDGAIHLTLEEAVMKQCETEKAFNSNIEVVVVPELGMFAAKTTLGFVCPASFGRVVHSGMSQLENWRTWVPAEPITKSKNAMSWTTNDMLSLNASSPSGKLAFPQFIDANKPVIIRDLDFDNWVGVFMPNRVDDNGVAYTVDGATLPDWW